MAKRKGFDLWRIAEAGLGLYLFLPSVEDVASGGFTLLPSGIVGAAMMAHAFGFKL